jgi:hypothetical protein
LHSIPLQTRAVVVGNHLFFFVVSVRVKSDGTD